MHITKSTHRSIYTSCSKFVPEKRAVVRATTRDKMLRLRRLASIRLVGLTDSVRIRPDMSSVNRSGVNELRLVRGHQSVDQCSAGCRASFLLYPCQQGLPGRFFLLERLMSVGDVIEGHRAHLQLLAKLPPLVEREHGEVEVLLCWLFIHCSSGCREVYT